MANASPEQIRFERPAPSHVPAEAKTDLLLAERLRRIPEFSVAPRAETTVCPGLFSIRNLPLIRDRNGLRD